MRWWVRRLAIVAVVVVLAGVAYVGASAIESRRALTLPEPAGGGAVGRRTFEWTDATRDDALARAGHAGPRRLSVWMWYPAAAAGGRRAPYAPGLWGAVHLPWPVAWGETRFGSIRTRSVEDARPAAAAGHLVVLSPGLGFSVVQYQSLAESLASHGYVVAAFTPTYSANVTVLGGQVVKASATGRLPDGSLYRQAAHAAALRLLATWVADAEFVARRARHAVGGVRLRPGVLYVGHSFGGATSLQACHEDRGCLGAVNIDGLDIGTVSTSGLAAPMLLLGHAGSCVTALCHPSAPDDRRDRSVAMGMVRSGTGPTWSVDVGDTAHFDFTDYAAYRLALPLRLLLPLGGHSGSHGLLAGDECVLDFLDRATGVRPRWGCLDGRLPGTTTRAW